MNLFRLSTALVMAAAFSQAAPMLTLTPPDGAITGQAGRVTGWGFTLTPDGTYWTSVIGVVLLDETDPSLGWFTDFISAQGGPSAGVLAPGAAAWTQAFEGSLGKGFGSYAIDPGRPTGSNAGTFLVLYELFSDDPNTCGACFADSGSLEAPFRVDAVPEPGTWGLLASSLLLGASIRAFRRDRA